MEDVFEALNERGCGFGKITRERVDGLNKDTEEVKRDLNGIATKFTETLDRVEDKIAKDIKELHEKQNASQRWMNALLGTAILSLVLMIANLVLKLAKVG